MPITVRGEVEKAAGPIPATRTMSGTLENFEKGVQLVPPSQQYKESYIAGIRELQQEGRYLEVNLEEVERDFATHLHDRFDNGWRTKDGEHVPATTRWLIVDGKYAGRVSIRHVLSEKLASTGGHIGYDVVPWARRRGYGKLLLEQALPIARSLGITRVLLTCDETNEPSRKIIESCGGKLENVLDVGEGTPRKMRFWIENS